MANKKCQQVNLPLRYIHIFFRFEEKQYSQPPFQGGQGMSATHIQLGVRLGWPGGLHHPHLVRWIFPLKLTG